MVQLKKNYFWSLILAKRIRNVLSQRMARRNSETCIQPIDPQSLNQSGIVRRLSKGLGNYLYLIEQCKKRKWKKKQPLMKQ